MPTIPPTFEGVEGEFDSKGGSYEYNNEDTTEIIDDTKSINPSRKMHLRSAGPIKEVVTLSTRFKTNAK